MRRQVRQARRIAVAGNDDGEIGGSDLGDGMKTAIADGDDVYGRSQRSSPADLGGNDVRDPFKQLVDMYRELDARQAAANHNGWTDGKHRPPFPSMKTHSGDHHPQNGARSSLRSLQDGNGSGNARPGKGQSDGNGGDSDHHRRRRRHHVSGEFVCGEAGGRDVRNETEAEEEARRRKEQRTAEALEKWAEAKRKGIADVKRRREQEEEEARRREEQNRAEEAVRHSISDQAVREWNDRKEAILRHRRDAELAKKQAVRSEVDERKRRNQRAIQEWTENHKPEGDRRRNIRLAEHLAPWDDNFGGALDIAAAIDKLDECQQARESGEPYEDPEAGIDQPQLRQQETVESYTWAAPREKGRPGRRKVQVHVRQVQPGKLRPRSPNRKLKKSGSAPNSKNIMDGSNSSIDPANCARSGGERTDSGGKNNGVAASVDGSKSSLRAFVRSDQAPLNTYADENGEAHPADLHASGQRLSAINASGKRPLIGLAGSRTSIHSSRRSSRISNQLVPQCSHAIYSVVH